MLLRRLYDEKLAQASYLVGCQRTGEALVVDPNRDIERYVRAAAAEGLRVAHVTETHIHADFVSGSRELAQRTGAALYLSAEGGPDWQYAFAATARARLLHDNDRFMVGNVRIDVLHTPGHTPEHLSFVVTDTAGADRPMGVFTGDFIFVGDVGRPDLLERAAKVAGTMEAGARQLFAALQRFKALPDYLQLWPGHGAGSACGKALGAVPQSTLGYERLFNWGLAADDEAQFVATVLAGQPEPPTYFAEMKRINRDGPALRGQASRPAELDVATLRSAVEAGAPVADLRPSDAFKAGHLPGTLHIPLNRSFPTWAGWLLPYDRDVYLVVDAARLVEATRDLGLIGLDRVAGFVTPESLARFRADGGTLDRMAEMTVGELAARRDEPGLFVLDVRARSEWENGHLPGVGNVPVGLLAGRLDELPRDRTIALHCQGGGRSAIAASVLAAHGIHDVVNVAGGFGAWQKAGHPVETGAPVTVD